MIRGDRDQGRTFEVIDLKKMTIARYGDFAPWEQFG